MAVGGLETVGAAPLSEVRAALADSALGIPLRSRQGVVRAYAVVDAADYERISAHSWYLHQQGYPVRQQMVDGKQHTLQMGRAVLGLGYGDSGHVDHINHDKLDNRKSNLRVVTHALNHQNRVANRGGTSRHRGVSWHAGHQRWTAQAKLNQKQIYIGYFADEDEAAEAAARWRAENMTHTVEGEVPE